MKQAFRTTLVAMVATSALALTACAATGTDDDAPAATGGTLTYAYAVDATTLDPIGIRDASNSLANGSRAFAIYDGLFALDPVTGALVSRIAESIEPSEDGTSQTLTLREGVTFSDGTAFDAEAVKFNWERLQDPANNALSAAYANRVSNMTVVDERTLSFDTEPATTQFGHVIARYFPFVGSPTAIEEKGAEFGVAPVGAGPFVVENWVQGSQLDLVANPDYWQGAPTLDGIVMRFVPDAQQRLQGLQTGELQLIDGNPVLWGQAEGTYDTYKWQSQGPNWLGMNAYAAPFDNPLAVEAMKYAVDSKTYASNFFGVAAESYFSSTSPYYDESGVFTEHDPKKAQELLDEYAAETGGPLTFDIMTPAAYSSSAEGLQALLSSYQNIKVGIRPMDGSTNLTAQLAGDFQAAVFGAIFADPYPEMHEQLITGSGRNFTNTKNTELDAILGEAALATSQDERTKLYVEAGKIITTLPWAPLMRTDSGLISLQSVTGVETLNDFVPDWSKLALAG